MSPHHSSTKTMSKTPREEIVVIVEKVSKRIFTSEKFFKDIVGISEIRMEMELLATSTTSL
jgi:hypothetical protein